MPDLQAERSAFFTVRRVLFLCDGYGKLAASGFDGIANTGFSPRRKGDFLRVTLKHGLPMRS